MDSCGGRPHGRHTADKHVARLCHPILASFAISLRDCLVFSMAAPLRGATRRESCRPFSGGGGGRRRRGLGGPWDDAAFVTRCGAACQAGEPRALAAALSRTAALPQARAAGQPDAIAILMRRTLTRTIAPILSSLRRMVPQLASVNGV